MNDAHWKNQEGHQFGRPSSNYKASNNKIYYDFSKMESDINEINTIITKMMSQKHNYSPGKMDSTKAQDPDTVVKSNKTSPPLESVNYM